MVILLVMRSNLKWDFNNHDRLRFATGFFTGTLLPKFLLWLEFLQALRQPQRFGETIKAPLINDSLILYVRAHLELLWAVWKASNGSAVRDAPVLFYCNAKLLLIRKTRAHNCLLRVWRSQVACPPDSHRSASRFTQLRVTNFRLSFTGLAALYSDSICVCARIWMHK